MTVKRVLKLVIISIVYILVLPFGFSAKLVYRMWTSTVLFKMFAQMFALVPGFPGTFVRTCYYNQTLRESHFDVEYSFGSVVSKATAAVGHRVYIGLYSSIGFAEIGEDTVLANYVSVLSGRHQHNFDNPDMPIFSGNDTPYEVKIGTNCFIGDKATIMANVGDRSIVGAGSVVISDIPERVIAAGNPARVIKQREQAIDRAAQ